MSRSFRCFALGAAVAALTSGCALQDTRYDYSRSGLPFADYDESIIDWNFPTTTSQGPLLPPQRLRPWRPAIGVPWATADANPMPWSNQAPISDSASVPSAGSHDSPSPDGDSADAAPASLADADPGLRDARMRDADQSRGNR